MNSYILLNNNIPNCMLLEDTPEKDVPQKLTLCMMEGMMLYHLVKFNCGSFYHSHKMKAFQEILIFRKVVHQCCYIIDLKSRPIYI